MRIRFRQVDVEPSVVHGPDSVRGFPLPPAEGDEGYTWEPFAIEFFTVYKPAPRSYASGTIPDDDRVGLAVWERLVE